MPRQDFVDQRPEPHEPPAQLERIDLKRLDEVVGGLRHIKLLNARCVLRLRASRFAQDEEGCTAVLILSGAKRSRRTHGLPFLSRGTSTRSPSARGGGSRP